MAAFDPEAARETRMGRKKACFGREDYVCLTKDCLYMNACIQAVWEKKISGLMRASKSKKVQESDRKATRTR